MHITTHESFGWFISIIMTILSIFDPEVPQRQLGAGIKQSPCSGEHVYRLLMIMWGVLTVPFRRFQQFLGKGDEVILLARNVTNE